MEASLEQAMVGVREALVAAEESQRDLEERILAARSAAKTAEAEATEARRRADQVQRRHVDVAARLASGLAQVPSPQVVDIMDLQSQARSLERSLRYTAVLQSVQTTSTTVQAALNAIATLDATFTSSPAAKQPQQPPLDAAAFDALEQLWNIHRALDHSACTHLQIVTAHLATSLAASVQTRLESSMRVTLASMGWPLCLTTTTTTTAVSAISTVPTLSKNDPPSTTATTTTTTTTTTAADKLRADFHRDLNSLQRLQRLTHTPTLAVVQLLLSPVRKRFNYHFSGDRKTNRADKPEWFFTHALSLIRDSRRWLHDNATTLMCSDEELHDALSEGIVSLVSAKVKTLVTTPTFVNDPVLFYHLMSECLAFERELRGPQYAFPSLLPGPISAVTCDADVFSAWLALERRLAFARLDQLLAAPLAWERKYAGDADAFLAPSVAYAVVTLVHSIADRCAPIVRPSTRLAFLNSIQKALLKAFINTVSLKMRVEFAQVPTVDVAERFATVANAVHYVSTVLTDMADEPEYLALLASDARENSGGPGEQQPQSGTSGGREDDDTLAGAAGETAAILVEALDGLQDKLVSSAFSWIASQRRRPTRDVPASSHSSASHGIAAATPPSPVSVNVFQEELTDLAKMQRDMVEAIAVGTVATVRTAAKEYLHSRFMRDGTASAAAHSLVTPALCEPLALLTHWLATVRESMAAPVYASVWRRVASLLDDFLFADLATQSRFDRTGALQFRTDLAALLLVFCDETRKPEAYMPKSVEAGLVLAMAPNEASQLLKAIQSDRGGDDALNDVGVYTLRASQVLVVMKRCTHFESFVYSEKK